VLLRPDVSEARYAEIGFVAALAVADAVDALLPRTIRASLKWPNDVLVQNGKIAGILLEKTETAIIIGIGLNVLHAPEQAAYPVATLVGCGGLATVDGTRDHLLTALAHWLDVWEQDGFPPVRAAWLVRAHPPGSPLGVRVGDNYITGQFVGIDSDGALLLDTAEGRGRVVAGDVIGVAA
jgi:BirA family biotin operon repressor/biotin-[acetyl-CoA-carboxylase] ligase